MFSTIPEHATGLGIELDTLYCILKREKSGTYRGKPYTKPAQIQINAEDTRFWIEWGDPALNLAHDPTGGFDPVPIEDRATLMELESYVAALEAHLGIIAQTQQTRDMDQPDLAPGDVERFLRSALPWCDADQRTNVARKTRMARAWPDQYVRTHKQALVRRGIDRPCSGLYVIALVDALQEINAAAEVDWKTDVETIYAHVSDLAAHHGIEIEPLAQGVTLPTHEILQAVGRRLRAHNLVLVALDIDADAYVLFVVPHASYAEVKAAADGVGLPLSEL